MRAIIYEGVGRLSVKEVPQPAVPPGGIVARVKACAICGTDYKMFFTENPRVKPPIIIGHEFSAEVVESDAEEFGPGDRITMATSISCGECWLCQKGLGNLCENKTCLGTDAPGAFAEYVSAPQRAVRNGNIAKIPDSVSDELACLAEPLSCVINSQDISGVSSGEAVLIIGAGPLGCLHLLSAKARGAGTVIISQRSGRRAEFARELGADLVIASEAPTEQVMEVTKGRGADKVFVCAPDRKAHEIALSLVRKGGVVNFFASLPKGDSEVKFDTRTVHYGEIRLTGASDSRPEHIVRALELLSDEEIPWSRLITHRLPLQEIHRGIELIRTRSAMKVLICA